MNAMQTESKKIAIQATPVASMAVQCILVVCLAVLSALCVALLSGLVAVVLVGLAAASLGIDRIQGITSASALVLTLAAAPVLFHALFVCLQKKTGTRLWIRASYLTLRAAYPRLLVFLISCLAGGWLTTLVFERLVHTGLLWGVRTAVLLLIGVAAILLMYRSYLPRKRRPRSGARPKSGFGSKSGVGPKQDPAFVGAQSAEPRSCRFASTPGFEPVVIPAYTTGFGHKALRVFLALLLFAGSIPSLWLYLFSGATQAWATEAAPLTEFSGEQPVPNTYEEPTDTTQQEAQREAQQDAEEFEQLALPLKEPEVIAQSEPEGAAGELFHDRYSTTYQNSDGTYTTRIQNDPLTYTDEAGAEHDINNTLIDTGMSFVNAANSYHITLPKEGGSITFEKDGYALQLVPLFGELNNPIVRENAVRYNNVAHNIDVQYTIWGAEVKEDIILASPVAFDCFEYELAAEGIEFQLEDNVVRGFVANGTEGERSESIFTIDAPLMSDAAGAVSEKITLELEISDAHTLLRLIPDAQWLSAFERVWPVVIDPSHPLRGSNLTQGTVQAFAGYFSGPDLEHRMPYLYVGFEQGELVATADIKYGQCWSYIEIGDISSLVADLPERAILSATLSAWKYSGPGGGGIDAKMIVAPWSGDGRRTWNNRPQGGGLTYLDRKYPSSASGWLRFDITDAFKEWNREPATNRGLMLTPASEAQGAVAISGSGNVHGQQALYIDLAWTVPQPVEEDMALDTPMVNLRPLTYKDTNGMQNLVGLFADGLVRPALEVDYTLERLEGDTETPTVTSMSTGTYPKAEYEPDYPNSDLFTDQLVFTLGYRELYESNWQTELIMGDQFEFDTLYRMRAQGTRVYDVWANPDNVFEQTPWGESDRFLVYQFKEQDTLPYVAAYYGVSREQIALDNRIGDDLAMPANTFFIRDPKTTIPYSRPDELTLAHKRALIYANMGRSQVSEFDMEPVNMNTGNFYLEQVDATSSEYGTPFVLTRSYNALAPQAAGPFGRGWASAFQQVLTGRSDGSVTWVAEDGRHLVFTKTDVGWAGPAGSGLVLERYANDDPHLLTWKITKPDGVVLTFDSYGILSAMTDSGGLVTAIAYDADYRMDCIITASGRTYDVSTDGQGRISTVALPNGALLHYEYDAQGYLTSFTDADGATVRYEYDEHGQMSTVYDGRGVRIIANEYDDQGRVIVQTDALGASSTVSYTDGQTTLIDATGTPTVYCYDERFQTTSIERAGILQTKNYNEAGQLISQTDGVGRMTSYAYDASGNIGRITRSDGSFQQIDYNELSLPVRIRDFDGSITTNSYDAQGNLILRTNPDETTVSYTYDAYGRMSSLIDEAGNTTTFAWNGTSSLITTDAAGNVSISYYDSMGRLINEVDAEGIEHKVMYSPAGRQTGTWQTGGIATAYIYDAAGNCVAMTDERGVFSSYSYDAANRLIEAAGPEGSRIGYAYDALGNKTSETDSLGNTTSYTYDAHGNLLTTTGAIGNTQTNTWDGAGRLVSTVDASGAMSTYAYAGAIDKAIAVTSPAGTNTFVFDAAGRELEYHGADGSVRQNVWDEVGRLAKTTDAAGLVTSYTYDACGNLVAIEDSAGRTERHTFDATGNMTSLTDGEGNLTRYVYDGAGRLTSVIAPGNLTWTYALDPTGNVTELTRPDGSALRFVYDAAGNMTSAYDAAGNTTEYHYDDIGNLKATVDALGATLTYAWDANQRLIEQTGALSQTVSYCYDAAGRPVCLIDEREGVSTLEYDVAGRIVKITGADGSVATTEYDAAGRIVKTVDAASLITQYEYDAFGNLVRQYDNAGYDVRFSYDNAGRLIEQTDALGRVATFVWDSAGQLVQTTDFNGDTTSLDYDLAGRVVRTQKSTGEDVSCVYDEAGNLMRETDAFGRETNYTYNALGQMLTRTDAAGNTWEYVWDTTGNCISVTDPEGICTQSAYDAAGRLISEIDGLGAIRAYAYDLAGRLLKSTEPNGAVREYSWDAAGNLTQEKDALGQVWGYHYDAMNRLIQTVSPLGARTSYTFDAHGNLTSQSDPLGNVTTSRWSLSDLLLERTLPSGLVESYDYDAAGRLVQMADSAGLSTSFAYDASGNVVSQRDWNGAITTFSYDEAHRLLATTDGAGATSFNQYDARGNLIAALLPGGASYSYEYDELDRPTSSGREAVLSVETTYDSAGRILATVQGQKENRYTWDAAGNLLSTTDPLGNTAYYRYDEMGLPIAYEDKNGATSTYRYDKAGNLVEWSDPSGAKQLYAWDAHGNMASTTDALGATTSFAWDLADNLTAVRDPLGRVASYTHDAAGNVTSATFTLTEEQALYGATAFEQALLLAAEEEETWTYSYDLHGNLTEIRSPTGKVETFAYDVASRLTSYTSPGKNTISYDYDLLGQMLEKSYDEAQETVVFAYDSAGRRVSMDDEGGTSTYAWDDAGRLALVTDANGRAIKYSWDEYGRLGALVYPDGRTVEYRYDLADNLICVSDSKTGDTVYTYDAEGNVLSCARPDGTWTNYTWDVTGRLVLLENFCGKREEGAGGELLSSFAYAWDATGQIIEERVWQRDVEEGEALAAFATKGIEAAASNTQAETALDRDAGSPTELVRNYRYDAAGELKGFSERQGETQTETTYSYNLSGNRVARSVTGDGTQLTQSEYDAEGRLLEQRDAQSGEVVHYEYDEDGNLVTKRTEGQVPKEGTSRQTVETTYSYDVEGRLEAVREGGALLMAATYDGDGNRVFQLHRTTVPLEESTPALAATGTGAVSRDFSPLDALGAIGSLFSPSFAQTSDTYSYLERIYPNDFYDWAFCYGFGQGLVTAACIPDMAFAPLAQQRHTEAFDEFLSLFSLEHRYDVSEGFSEEDLEALEGAGLSAADLYDVLYPEKSAEPEGKDAPQAPETSRSQGAEAALDETVIIPANTTTDIRYDYELTYYVNDISYQNVQVALAYGKRGEQKASYTYGLERIGSVDAKGDVQSYLYDGRGSVVQTYLTPAAENLSFAQGALASSLTYDPWGTIRQGADENALAFAYNAEEYNPVTGLIYLRARYYAPDAANFITKDDAFGSLDNINSQNRYAYAEADPINNHDPAGHAISNNSYERAMEAAGGINEIYNFYVGHTLQNVYNAATSAFNAQLGYAYGVDYRSLFAINSIAGISQATANAYITQGAAAALRAGSTWGCAPGALTGAAIGAFATNVNVARESTNQKIAAVKANKQSLYRQYQVYLAWVAEQQRIAAAQAAKTGLKRQATTAAQRSESQRISRLARTEQQLYSTHYQPLPPLGYDRSAAVNYAQHWAYDTNEDYYDYGQDCANFVSQILHAGGVDMNEAWHSYKGAKRFDPRFWNYKYAYDWDVTSTWRLAADQYEYFSNPANGYTREEPLSLTRGTISFYASTGDIQPGDLLYFAGPEGTNVHHAAAVSRVDASMIYYTAHTEPNFNRALVEKIGDETVLIIRIRD
ncbi:MAG: amidase domain-containing protein [Coriobacteriales bacterium]|jgi:RHS repeat-associated protein|nr:amidase domain-containing protein [Coriobacteriales bacterium]